MHKFIQRLGSAGAVVVGLAVPLMTRAISFLPTGIEAPEGIGTNDPATITISIIEWALGILGLIAVTLILYGGFTWMTAGGEEKRIETAKGILKAAIIGLVIIMTAYGVAQYVFEQLITATGGTAE